MYKDFKEPILIFIALLGGAALFDHNYAAFVGIVAFALIGIPFMFWVLTAYQDLLDVDDSGVPFPDFEYEAPTNPFGMSNLTAGVTYNSMLYRRNHHH